MTPSERRILQAIVSLTKPRGPTVGQVAEVMGYASRPTLSRVISGLIQRGLLARDKRTKNKALTFVSLTTRGHAALDEKESA